MAIPIPARSLHLRRIVLRDTALEEASLFPFFDDNGIVRAQMLVWPGTDQIFLIEQRSGLVRSSWWRLELDLGYADLRDADVADAKALRDTSHYDPWWVLREPRFARHRAVPVLKATNNAKRRKESVSTCWFRPDLSRVAGDPAEIFKPRESVAVEDPERKVGRLEWRSARWWS